MAKPTTTLRKGTAESIVARHKPGGAAQDISSDTIEADFAKNKRSAPVLQLSSVDAAQIEKLTAESQSSTAVTSFTASSDGGLIEAAGATFVDNEVLKGEELVVTGSQAGTYTVKQVVDNTRIRVNETVTTDAAPSSTLVVNRGVGWFKVILDVADMATLSAALDSQGVMVLYRTPSGGEKQYLGTVCFVLEELPA